MASLLLLHLLHLLLMVSTTSAWYYWYYTSFGRSVSFTPKGRKPDGTYVVNFRQRTNAQYFSYYYYTQEACFSGDCGNKTLTNEFKFCFSTYDITYRQYEVTSERQLTSNLPFELRYPGNYDYDYLNYWVPNVQGDYAWRMMTHVDLGTRMDTGQSNRPPIIVTPHVLRVPWNCPRTFNFTLFDPDGDRVRCRQPTISSTQECAICSLNNRLSLDENSCSITYNPYYYYNGYIPVELVVEDFPNKDVRLSYSDGSYTTKRPLSASRWKRQVGTTTFPTTAVQTNTTASPTNTTAGPTNATAAQTNTTAAPTTTTAAPTNATAAQTNTTAAPTNATAALTNDTAAPTTTTAAPTTTFGPNTQQYRSTIGPLSKLPLQFTIYVDYNSAPSCVDGDYFPIFLAPTPANGVNLPAYVNHTLEIKVKSEAQFTMIRDLIVTGPQGISKEQVSTDTYIIKWTPTDNELNDHFPICFVSEAVDSNYYYWVYHSELRCVTVDVGQYEVAVTCNETTMTVELGRTYNIRQNEDKLHLNDYTDPSCNLTRLSNETHLVAVLPLGACGTFVEEDDKNIYFKNDITIADPNEVITRSLDFDIAIICSYPKRTNLTLGFSHKNPYAFREKGFGAFTFQFEFFESQRYRKQVNSSSYPMEVYLKEMIFMQIEATTSIPNTELFVESCRATPYDNPNSRISYTIIENGCVKDKTVQIYPSPKSQFRFGMEAFEFIGAHDEVYITCSVVLCETGVAGTRCSQGCITSSSGHRLSKRAASAQTDSHSISQGPLHLARTSDTKASGPGLNLNLGLNMVFIVGCLLVCGLIVYRSRRNKAKYERLPTSDTE